LISPSSKSDAFPIGGIIAIPGSFVPATEYWAAADGRELSKADYSNLYAVLQDAWGSPSSADKFMLPKFNGMFLRATDLSNPSDADPWGDPDRAARTVAIGSKAKAYGTGSYQDFSTALPRNAFNIGIGNPRDDQYNAAGGSLTISAFTNAYSDFMVAGGDPETAPRSVGVAFYIKIKAA
jgi:microcystin-dependent protein